MNAPIEGGCLCGAIRYTISAPVAALRACHCTHCQKNTGSGMSVNAVVAGKDFAITANDNWGGAAALQTAFAQAGAFALPNGSNDAAVVVRLPPGGYTVVVSGVGNTTGTALVEIYDLDP